MEMSFPLRARPLFRSALLVVLLAANPVLADDPPQVNHQAIPCTVPDQPFTVCAEISDDGAVKAARVYFRAEGEDFYYYVEMAFGGLEYCATLPSPREGKVKTIDYYVQAVDDQFQITRGSSYVIAVQPEATCGFAPVERDKAKLAGIKVFAMHKKQGDKLSDHFDRTGIAFVPVGKK